MVTLTATPTSAAGLTDVLSRSVTMLEDLARLFVTHLPMSAVEVIAAVAVAVAGTEWRGHRQHLRDHAGATRVLILPGPRVDPAGAQAFWQHLLGLLPPRRRHRRAGYVVFEYVFTADGLAISVWVPSTVAADLVAAAARSAWPGSRTTIEPATPNTETTPTTPTSSTAAAPAGLVSNSSTASIRSAAPLAVAGGVLRLARPAGLPIRTDHPADPLRGLIGAAGPLRPGHSAVVQVLARPMSAARFAALTRSRAGRHGGGAPAVLAWVAGKVAVGLASLVQELAEIFIHGPGHRTHHHSAPPRSRTADHDEWEDPGWGVARRVESARDRAIAGKVHSPGGGYRTLIRYQTCISVAANANPGAAQNASVARAHALASAFAEFSGHNHFRRRHLRRPLRAIAGRRLRRGDPLSVPELAALAHLPTDEHVPGLRRAGAAAIAPPPQIPTAGHDVRPLGDSDAVAGRAVGLTVADARHHLWIIGATGAGKSTLCVHSVLADAAAGRAAIVLDPKGDLVTDILARLPQHARTRTVLIDPDQPPADGWPRLNPLDPLRGQFGAGGDNAVENVVSVFSRVFSSAWGHRSEDLLRVACLTLRAGHGPASLAEIPALLTDPTARRAAVAHLPPDGRLRQFWTWFDQLPDSARAQIGAPLLNKLRAILLRPFAEQLLCGPSTVDLSRLLDTGGLLLVRLPKGVLGEDTVRLIGSLLVAQVWQATLRRATQPEHQRRDASLLLDECHNFLHMPYRIEDMLAEARAFRLSITLAHQHLGQLTPALRDGIATNARNKAIFAVSPEDAAVLARHTLPELSAHDLAHLDGFHAVARLMSGTSEARAFTFTTRPLPPIPCHSPQTAPGYPNIPAPGRRVPIPASSTQAPPPTGYRPPGARHPDPRRRGT